MKKYFLHLNNETIGPFALEELKANHITPSTPVWFEGMENWQYATDIPELKPVLIATPPPIKSFNANPPMARITHSEKPSTILGLSKNAFWGIIVLLLLTIGTIAFDNYQDTRSEELERKNKITERENQQFLLQQKEIEEQKARIAQTEKAEAERQLNERKQTINSRLIEIKSLLTENKTNLEDAKNKLVKAKDFKILRTSNERNEEINTLQTQIDFLKDEILKLEEESNQLNLELERIH